MTTKELLALVADWRRAAHQLRGDCDPMPTSAMRLDDCADELEAALPALCAEVEALRKDAERWRAYERELPDSADSTRVFLHGVAVLKAAKLAAKEPTK